MSRYDDQQNTLQKWSYKIFAQNQRVHLQNYSKKF